MEVDVFTLGRVYTKIVEKMKVTLNDIDPALCIYNISQSQETISIGYVYEIGRLRRAKVDSSTHLSHK
jgi:hypothetical protein